MVQTRARYNPNPHLSNMSTSEEQIAELAQVVETLHQQITFLNQQVNNQANDLQAALKLINRLIKLISMSRLPSTPSGLQPTLLT